MFKFRRKADLSGTGIGFLICFIISALLIFFFSFISALILNKIDDPTKNIGLFSLVAMLFSAAASGIVCSRLYGEKGMRFASLVALAVVLIMLLINVIVNAGKVCGGAFMNYGCYLGIYALCGYLCRKNGRRKRR